jgi:hypothetical protein
MPSIRLLIRPWQVDERVVRKPMRTPTPIAEANCGLPVTIASGRSHPLLSLLGQPVLDQTRRQPIEPCKVAVAEEAIEAGA